MMTETNTYKILIVDDNEAAAEVLGKLLAFRGYSIECVYSGEDALKIVSEYEPDAALIDIGLPDISGYDVARRMKNENTSTLLVAITGFGQERDKKEAHTAGFDHHLTKPASLADIEAVLADLKELPSRSQRGKKRDTIRGTQHK
jgi:CheY-like chemotaxis protein